MSEDDEAAARRMVKLCRLMRWPLIGQVLLGAIYFLVDTIGTPWGQSFTWPIAGLVFLPPAAFIAFFVTTRYFRVWFWPELVWRIMVLVLPELAAFYPFVQAYQKTGQLVHVVPPLILLIVYFRDAFELSKIWSRFGAQR